MKKKKKKKQERKRRKKKKERKKIDYITIGVIDISQYIADGCIWEGISLMNVCRVSQSVLYPSFKHSQ